MSSLSFNFYSCFWFAFIVTFFYKNWIFLPKIAFWQIFPWNLTGSVRDLIVCLKEIWLLCLKFDYFCLKLDYLTWKFACFCLKLVYFCWKFVHFCWKFVYLFWKFDFLLSGRLFYLEIWLLCLLSFTKSGHPVSAAVHFKTSSSIFYHPFTKETWSWALCGQVRVFRVFVNYYRRPQKHEKPL